MILWLNVRLRHRQNTCVENNVDADDVNKDDQVKAATVCSENPTLLGDAILLTAKCLDTLHE